MVRPLRALQLAVSAILLIPEAGAAQERMLPAAGSDAWQPLAFPKIERHTRYSVGVEDGESVLHAESECSASALLYPLRDVALETTPLLRWRWRVEEGLAPADERSKAGDDFAARVYVTFAFEPERASLFERAGRALAGAVYGEAMPGSALSYVWSSREPRGARWPNPFVASSQMIVATSGAATGWVDVEVDLLADYERAFSHAAPAAVFVALMTDTDNRCVSARASYAGLRLAARAGAKH